MISTHDDGDILKLGRQCVGSSGGGMLKELMTYGIR